MNTPVLEPQGNVDEGLSHGAQLATDLDGPPIPDDVTPPVVETPAGETPPASTVPPKEDDVTELRQIVRSLMRQNADLKSFLQRAPRAAPATTSPPAPKDPLDEVFGIKTEPPVPKEEPLPESPPTRYEELRQGLGYIGATKGPLLDTLVATMEMNSKFEDVRDVCSRDNLDTLVEQAAKRYVAANPGTDFVEATMEIELAIWSQTNPYKYMYDAIKATNPRYGGGQPSPTGDGVVTSQSPAQARAKEGAKPVIAPTSIIPLGGSDADKQSGWTSEKIASLDDDAYAKLPEDIRLAYLAGDFDVK